MNFNPFVEPETEFSFEGQLEVKHKNLSEEAYIYFIDKIIYPLSLGVKIKNLGQKSKEHSRDDEIALNNLLKEFGLNFFAGKILPDIRLDECIDADIYHALLNSRYILKDETELFIILPMDSEYIKNKISRIYSYLAYFMEFAFEDTYLEGTGESRGRPGFNLIIVTQVEYALIKPTEPLS
jgi:hypothetical protein